MFEAVNLSDLLDFQLSQLDDEAKPIKFSPNEIPVLTFNIQVIKMLKVKKTYGSLPRNDELTKLTTEIIRS